ncbi:MAG: HAD-IIIA family hydrolase [Bacteriovoracaceae bacterium]|jgi:D-glycero-D-manno-heptose 1,7-bisphosphate phosphatase|nr:HAD-IIIA family hydrolase [Bacteriovoracaceae bacterium]
MKVNLVHVVVKITRPELSPQVKNFLEEYFAHFGFDQVTLLKPGESHNLKEEIQRDFVLYFEKETELLVNPKNFVLESNHQETVALCLATNSADTQEILSLDENSQIRQANLEDTSDFHYISPGICLYKTQNFHNSDTVVKKGSAQSIFPIGGNDKFTPPRSCLFLDRDGILIEDSKYPHKKEDLKFISEIVDLIKWCNQNQIIVVVLTNQAGIAKEYFSLDEYHQFTTLLLNQLEKMGGAIEKIYFCPYHPEGKNQYKANSLLRKPNPGMALMAASEFNIDLTKSIMIGDKESDALGLFGLKTILKQGNYPISDNYHPFSSFTELACKARELLARAR